jgi:cell division protein FtsI/penicillin-binding protein 2
MIDSTINIDQKYIDRVRASMRYSADPNSPLLGSLIDFMPNAAAKTGTAEGFYDTDGDGYINTEYVFISEAFMAFAPYNDPDMAIFIHIPNVRYLDGDEYKYPAREELTREVTKIYYEMY